MKIIGFVRSIAWAFIMLIVLTTAVPVKADMTFHEFTKLLFQGGVISAEKYSLALEVATVADAEIRDARVKNQSVMTDITADKPSVTLGLVVGEGKPGKFLIRAIGPTLIQFGVESAMANPRLTAYKSSNAFAGNADWSVGLPDTPKVEEASRQVGAFPLPRGSRDAAFLLELGPGDYTFIAEGILGSTGRVLLEIYPVPSS